MSADLVDAHCHLDLPTFSGDREAVWARAREQGVTRAIVPAVRPDTWRATLDCALPGERVVALGIHPHALLTLPRAALDRGLKELAATVLAHRDRVVAIGECGLDASLDPAAVDPMLQRQVFLAQVAVAAALDLPLVLHVVRSHALALALLKTVPLPSRPGMVHSYSGGPELVRAWTALGFHLSFGGAVTRPRARAPVDSVKAVPDNRLLVETDAPDQLPTGVDRSDRRCEPCDLPVIVRSVAAFRAQSVEHVAEVTTANARALFGLL